MSPAQRRPALLLGAAGALLGGLGFLLGDERLAALCWLLAVPMIATGLVTLAWGNARAEIERHLRSRD